MYQATLPIRPARPDAGADRIAEKLAQGLGVERARHITVAENTVRFTGGFFRSVNRWNLLVPISRGENSTSSRMRC